MTLNPDHPNTPNGGTRETAQQEAGRLGSEAQGAARQVADTARHEAGHVKDEAMAQARSLADSAKQEASAQLSTQQERLAGQSRTISEDLERISRGERPESDLVNQAVTMLSDRARQLTEQLETKEPTDLLDDVRRFAARRPGTFLAIAAGIGLLAGRLTRGLTDAHANGGHARYTPAPGPSQRTAPAAPVTIDRVPGSVYPDDVPASGGLDTPRPSAAPGVPGPYGAGTAEPGGRP